VLYSGHMTNPQADVPVEQLSSMSLPQSERLAYRPLILSDGGFLCALLNDRDFLKYVGDRQVRVLADVERYLREGPWANYARHGLGLLALDERATGRTIGIAGLIQRPTLNDVDLGYALLPEARGRGYAREATCALLDQARSIFGLPRVLALIDPGNERSIRVAESCGFSPAPASLAAAANHGVSVYAVAFRQESQSSASRSRTASNVQSPGQ